MQDKNLSTLANEKGETFMNKKLITFGLILALITMLTSCASKEVEEPEAKELVGTVNTVVLEHKGTALGVNLLPVWVETYIYEGITGVEKLKDYQDKYCFVAEEISTDLRAGLAWAEGVNMPQTIARNVQTRVESTFSGASSGALDSEYNTYFENIVKTITDIDYSGAKEAGEWWVLVRRYDNDVKKKYTDEYRIYSLYTMDKDYLDMQIINAIDKAAKESEPAANKDQLINSVKEIIKAEGLK